MPNPPYSGTVIIIKENQDGLNVKCWNYAEIPDGTPMPKGPAALESALFTAMDTSKGDTHIHRMFSTRTATKTGFGQLIDAKFPDTGA